MDRKSPFKGGQAPALCDRTDNENRLKNASLRRAEDGGTRVGTRLVPVTAVHSLEAIDGQPRMAVET